ncbi:hypothetical protein FFLO_05399 [Filobasidium floriforme]|uniref:DNA helicase n=1 Tax=Filobasidium floriforme TaxID=5210 RepID=A0A8K0NN91_9TREE|nr:hypothetical protein FFLO_05399 [Filobasidium floriforme]
MTSSPPPPPLYTPHPPSQSTLHAFLTRQLHLLAAERQAEIDQTSLLASNCSPRLLEKRGLAIGGLSISSTSIGLGGKTLIELYLPQAHHNSTILPSHTFRTGDPARLEPAPSSSKKSSSTTSSARDKDKDKDSPGVEGVVARVTNEKIVLSLSESGSGSGGNGEGGLKLANSATFDRMESTLRHLARLILPPEFITYGQLPSSSNSVENAPLLQVLFGLRQPTLKPKEKTEPVQWFDETLNESQKRAVEFVLGMEEVGCIHGPPGTGKTFTLVEIIRQLVVVQGKRVLVCGASNLAVDNLLARLSPLFPPKTLLRLGHPARISPLLLPRTLDYQASHSEEADLVRDVKGELEGNMKTLQKGKGEKGRVWGKERGKVWEEVRELRKEYRTREAKVVKNVVAGAQVVLSTCHGSGSRQINNMDFDVCIIDEATQAVEAVCWIPILKSKKLILAGDPLQLPPTILSANNKSTQTNIKLKPIPLPDEAELRPPRTLETTLFDRLERIYGPGIKRLLAVQYRMNETISAFPSDALYNSQLVNHESVAKRRLIDLPSITDPTSEDAQDTLTPTLVFFDTAGSEMYERLEGDGEDGSVQKGKVGEGSRYNENEAEIVSRWVRKLIALGVPEPEVAIITPYQAQVAHIASMLREEFPDLVCGSVDGMQGQEREAVVLSLVRSNATREVGFLAEERRLNVAMTRAKRQLCVVGDSSTVSQGSKYLKAWMDHLEEHADVRFALDEM